MANKRKQSLYFPQTMLEEIKSEAQRLDRSLSWMIQRAWKLAREELARFPSANEDFESQGDDSGI